jgi:aspartate aminotransferase
MRDTFLKRRDLVLGLLAEIPGLKTRTPEGAFYLFPDVSAYFGKSFEGKNIKNASDLSIFLLEQANIAVVTGEAFGDENCIRFSYAAADDILIEAVKRMKAALEKLQ